MLIEDWMAAFTGCHSVTSSGIIRHAWPDGGCYLEQEAMVTQLFATIRDEFASAMEAKSGKR